MKAIKLTIDTNLEGLCTLQALVKLRIKALSEEISTTNDPIIIGFCRKRLVELESIYNQLDNWI